MGTDVHICLEKRVGDKWVMVNRLDGDAAIRNYELFADLAGVRGSGPPPKGLPDDLSESARLFVDEWAGDAHSHSWHALGDAVALFNAPRMFRKRLQFPAETYFGVPDEADLSAYRIVYFFDN